MSTDVGVVLKPSASPLVELLRGQLRSGTYRPPMLPAAALQLLTLTRDPDADIGKVRDLIASEPMIAAQVVATAQSAHYSAGQRVESIEDAIVRIGMGRLSTVFFEAALQKTLYNSVHFKEEMERLRNHSVRVAFACRLIAERLRWPTERAFLAGLLHDVGAGACFTALEDIPGISSLPEEMIHEAVLAVHEEATNTLGRIWHLPEGVLWVAAHHHDIRVGGKIRPMQAMVNLADHIAALLGCGLLAEHDARTAFEASEYLGFGAQEIEQLTEKANTAFLSA